jgi:hypothetical protein
MTCNVNESAIIIIINCTPTFFNHGENRMYGATYPGQLHH